MDIVWTKNLSTRMEVIEVILPDHIKHRKNKKVDVFSDLYYGSKGDYIYTGQITGHVASIKETIFGVIHE